MSIYRCTICEQQKDSDFNCADGQKNNRSTLGGNNDK